MGHKTRQSFMIRAIPALIATAFAGTAATSFAAGEALEEVIITAQKRSENLQDVPISVMSFDAKTLEKKGVITLSDINDGSVPGLSLAPYPGSNEIFFPTFRGVTTNSSFIANPNPIAVHVNGVYQSQLVGLNNPAADLERIEVLKGPQGVMSGRNATGGALNIYTAKPDLSAFGFKQQITLAQREQFISKTTVNVPVTENLAVKIAYVHSSRGDEGIKNSAPNGVKFGEREADAWRFDLRWKPANNVTVDYGYDYSKSEGYDTPAQCLKARSSYSFLAFDPRAATFVSGCREDRQSSLYGPSGIQKNRNQAEGHALNIEWEASPTLTVRSITGYRKIDTSNHYNYGAYVGGLGVRADSYPLTVTDPNNFNGGVSLNLGHPATLYNESWSQEFQFLGDLSKTFKYTAGVFFTSEKGNQYSGPNVGMTMPSASFFFPPDIGGSDVLFVDNKGMQSSKLDSWAVFGQLNWTPDILDQKLEIVPGIRFTKDHRRVTGYNTGWNNVYFVSPTTGAMTGFPLSYGFGFASAAAERSYSQTTPALSVNYHVNKDMMTYLKISKGFTAGGFDQVSGGVTLAGFSKGFEPETIKSVELGMKGEFMDRRLRTNMALFQSKFDNEQKSVSNDLQGWMTQNVGGSTYRGFEFDLTARVTDTLRASFSYATLSHKYDKWIDPVNGNDVTSFRKLNVPKNDATLTLDYRFPELGLPGKLDGSFTVSHRGATSTPINFLSDDPEIEKHCTIPSFTVVNARLALSRIKVGPGNNGDLTVALWGKNLADKKYLVMSNPGWSHAWSGNWGEPRTYGLDLIYQY